MPVIGTPLSETWMAPFTVEGLSGALANSVIRVFAGTCVAPLPGRWLVIEGPLVGAWGITVNWLVKSTSGLPERS